VKKIENPFRLGGKGLWEVGGKVRGMRVKQRISITKEEWHMATGQRISIMGMARHAEIEIF
jgi:hypothetical protein